MRTLAVLLLLTAVLSPVDAADFTGVDLQPYLAVSSKLRYATVIPPSTDTTEDHQLFITHGGATFSTFVLRSENTVPVTQIYRGVATPSQLDRLKERLNALAIRGQRSCEIADPFILGGRYDFTWYSRLGKRNSFVIALGPAGSSGLPRCRPGAEELIQAIAEFESEVLANPETEVLPAH